MRQEGEKGQDASLVPPTEREKAGGCVWGMGERRTSF